MWESKGVHRTHSCNITKTQIQGYRFLQYNFPKLKIFFSLYRHSLDGIRSVDRNEEEIVDELPERTLYSLVLPFSVISTMRDSYSGLVRHYDRHSSWPQCICINSRTTNTLLHSPSEVLEGLGLDSDDFDVERLKSPRDFSINRKRITPFPIVRISDKKHTQWAERFRGEYEEDNHVDTNFDFSLESLFKEQGKSPEGK